MTISDEAVEAAIGALSPTDAATIYPDAMHGALEAAAPFIRAEALEDAAGGWEQADPTPYTSDWLRARAAEMRQG